VVGEIYTRDYGKARRRDISYSPPPGYDGTAFGEIGMKMHEADVEISDLERGHTTEEETESQEEIYDEYENCVPDSNALSGLDDSVRRDSRTIEALFRSLRGKLGTEEIILILVLLIVASDGIGIEAMVLGLLLMLK